MVIKHFFIIKLNTVCMVNILIFFLQTISLSARNDIFNWSFTVAVVILIILALLTLYFCRQNR